MIEFIKKVKMFVVGAGAEMTHTNTEQEQIFLLELIEAYEKGLIVSVRLEGDEPPKTKIGQVVAEEKFCPVVKAL